MRSARGARPSGIDEYLKNLPSEMRRALEELRRTIRTAAPDADELISYGMPAFRDHGMLVYFGAFKDHGSFFIGSAGGRRKFAAELKPFAAGKGTLRFTPERPLPLALVQRIVKWRLAENASRAASKRRPVQSSAKRSR
jgi:uncharacterized protein YdhG (YjbR/CyaY superfamily)